MILSDQRHLTAVLRHAQPVSGWERLSEVAFPKGAPALFPWSETGAWTVHVLWALVAGAVTVLAVHRRDQ
ncbi:hypothetical protein P8A18_22840 [Streptomyces castrisilvae]|uniref:Uncharacterized protein n=1 Tax=Streptomyces castrisilvae TaxID=3033811 RepID=A0ABY9HNG7_9ACTN|nr:hypothetical protein [Streptomyces sp. Mut1]WLQ36090.1 hypothetical protein P8A18_22840 [Streptomyces sp. Mut1]